MKLVELAEESVKILKQCGDDGIKSDELALRLDTPKRRVYDVIAVLRALGHVRTNRKFDGTTVTWIDRSKDYVEKRAYEELRGELFRESEARKEFQVQATELKVQLQISRAKLRRDSQLVESSNKTEFTTTQLRIRPLSSNGIKRVEHSSIEVLIETHEAGLVVDPSVIEVDENEALIKNLQKI